MFMNVRSAGRTDGLVNGLSSTRERELTITGVTAKEGSSGRHA